VDPRAESLTDYFLVMGAVILDGIVEHDGRHGFFWKQQARQIEDMKADRNLVREDWRETVLSESRVKFAGILECFEGHEHLGTPQVTAERREPAFMVGKIAHGFPLHINYSMIFEN